jgi:hypothetical protein
MTVRKNEEQIAEEQIATGMFMEWSFVVRAAKYV